MQIDVFKNGTNSYVTEQKNLSEVLTIIQQGDHNLDTIAELRRIGKSSTFFDELKMKLPSFRFNFNFNSKATNRTIKNSTGLIYIDVDNMTDVLDSNNLIHASWKSISTTGYGILVRIDGLTLDNYADNYNAVSEQLGLPTDVGARKATQQTILSFDPSLYHNPESTIFKAISKKVSSTIIKAEKREECIEVDDTFLLSGHTGIRFDNISDYFATDDTRDFITFDEKEPICIPFISSIIGEGNRNSRMFFLLSQYALLNPTAGSGFLRACAETINKHMVPSLTEGEVQKVITNVLKKRDEGSLTPHFNKERKIIFNPYKKLTKSAKFKIVGEQMGKVKTEKTLQNINAALEDWDFVANGKITQKKVAQVIGMSLVTIKRNWEPFKEFVSDLNANSNVVEAKQAKVPQTPLKVHALPLDFNNQSMLQLINQDKMLSLIYDKKYPNQAEPEHDWLVGLHEYILAMEDYKKKYIAINSSQMTLAPNAA